MRIFLPLLLLFSVSVNAEKLQVKTGKWETTSTFSNSMMPQPTTSTNTSCVENGVFEPEDMVNDAEGCEIKDSSVADNTLSFEMTCLVQGSETNVKGSFFSKGDKGNGNMKMSMKMGQLEMQVTTEWASTFLGPCD